MSDPTVRGQVHLIEDTKTFGRNNFRKRLLVLEQEDGAYTKYIPVHFIQDNCDSVDELQVGDEVEVSYQLTGRKWQRDEQSEVKFFLDAEANQFKVVKKSESTSNLPPNGSDPFAMVEEDDDEAPF